MRTIGLVLASLALVACSHVSSVRMQPDAVHVGDKLRPVAAIQADAMSLYLLFIPIPGVNLDRVINQMLIVKAKTMGADKVTNLRFDIDPGGGIWSWRRIAFYRSARASGIAVQVTAPRADPSAHLGPEPSPFPANTQGAVPPVSTLPSSP